MNTTQIPGNAGLRDQVTLLNWVKRNAKYFGGDPDDVTIAGQSAGAVSAHLLTLSQATEGLFKRFVDFQALNPDSQLSFGRATIGCGILGSKHLGLI